MRGPRGAVQALGACLLAGSALLAGCGHEARSLFSTEPGVSAVALAGADLWIGHKTLGLMQLPAAGGTARMFQDAAGLSGGRREVRWVTADGDDLWLATGAGVLRFSRSLGRVTAAWTAKEGLGGDSVRCVAVVRGQVWAGSIFGASRLLPGAKRWKNYQAAQGLSQNHVYRLIDDGARVWASCINGGLAWFDAAHDRWVPVPQEHGIGNKFIYAMALDPVDHALWLGTAGGINRYDPAKGLLRHPASPGAGWDVPVCEAAFTDYSVYAVDRSGDTLWFGTTYGLYRRDLTAGHQRLVGASAGLPGDEIVALAQGPDRLFVATRTGVASLPLK